MCQLSASFEIVKLVEVFHVIALKVEHCQVFQETNVEQLVDIVVADVEFFQLLTCEDALQFLELAASDVKHAHILEGGADVSEAVDNRVVQL